MPVGVYPYPLSPAVWLLLEKGFFFLFLLFHSLSFFLISLYFEGSHGWPFNRPLRPVSLLRQFCLPTFLSRLVCNFTDFVPVLLPQVFSATPSFVNRVRLIVDAWWTLHVATLTRVRDRRGHSQSVFQFAKWETLEEAANRKRRSTLMAYNFLTFAPSVWMVMMKFDFLKWRGKNFSR